MTRVQGTVTVAGTVTANAGTGTLAVSGPLTDTQLRAVAVPVSGTITADVGAGTQAVSAVSLPLPTGASTTAKQPALGTAGTPSADVISVQGVASGTVMPVGDNGGSLTVDNAGTFAVQLSGTNTVTQTPATSGGLTIYRLLCATGTNAASVKASAGQVYGWYLTNTDAAPFYVKLYNKASAPTVGTDTPVMTLLVSGNTAGAGSLAAEFVSGIAFGTGIALAITDAYTDASSTATGLGAGEVLVHLFYK